MGFPPKKKERERLIRGYNIPIRIVRVRETEKERKKEGKSNGLEKKTACCLVPITYISTHTILLPTTVHTFNKNH